MYGGTTRCDYFVPKPALEYAIRTHWVIHGEQKMGRDCGSCYPRSIQDRYSAAKSPNNGSSCAILAVDEVFWHEMA